MNIIILGAGQVGATLAENLAHENNDITVIDWDELRLAKLQNRLDIRTITGFGSHPTILQQAGAQHADMIIAVTNDDETNIVACQVADSVFHIPTKIARIRSKEYQNYPQLFDNNIFPIDLCINPENLITQTIAGLLEHPGSLQVINYADGRLQLVGVQLDYGGKFVGRALSELYAAHPEISLRIAAIYRRNRSLALSSDTTLEIGDEVFFITEKRHIKTIIAGLRRLDNPYKKIFIAGGGNIGLRLAAELEHQYQVVLIEHDKMTCHRIAEQLHNVVVLNGDACDSQLLHDENIEYGDVFCALTNDDEVNIMSALQAKRLGARKVLALTTRATYVDMIEGGDIDIAISPQLITIGSILTYLRRGDMVSVHSLRRGAAEVIEVVAHGDQNNSKVIGRQVQEIKWPKGITFGAIVRQQHIMLTDDKEVIEDDDHIILFLSDKTRLTEVEKLFQVGFGFF